MGGDYRKHALMFLNELSQLEEGRRYLKFSSKITNDIKKVLRKKVSSLEFETLETLNATLNLMHPPIAQFSNVTYYCKPADEGFGKKTVCALVQHRMYMTLDEIFTHLDLLQNLSNNECGKDELTIFLPALLCLFKNLLIEYDNSEMNIIITNILNNVVSKNMIKSKELPKTVIVADTATEPILMKDNYNQIPPKKSPNKSKLTLGLAPNKFKKLSKRKGSQ
ncbi:Uncharacterized protein OBRU01_13449 [Operophtera brumata]|uniref:Uncharacterized protein n=1 Tax=Operophtera brumata TaxID=104452 RepID=A0A0L7L7Z5_OPEBR|nr:Uncharacterized protein OBRU01_13449 [Operophtera brumata]